jgi:diketogulonate reductase-like aldo/keto reductase
MRNRLIPGTSETLPVVGLGAPDIFTNIPPEGAELPKAVVQAMVDLGGRVIDTQPFFRPDVPVIGELLSEMGLQSELFLTGKITVSGKQEGIRHLERTVANLKKDPMDLLMVHNMRDMNNHWPTLKAWKEAGKVRYIGVSRTREEDFDPLMKFMMDEQPDFLMIGYSITLPGPAERVLPQAMDSGIAVIGAQPFNDGAFFGAVAGKKLPDWTSDFDCESWAQFSLKYILSNPAITSVVTETSKVKHVIDNMRAGYGRLPDEAIRQKMSDYMLSL